ncbi:MAG: hypothetical protein QW270_05880 [Candidatus Bathyarchaeia archaeon]
MYYYISWGIPFNSHWKEDIKGTPFLGYYNPNDPKIANQYILFVKQHKISFFAVSWIGKDWINWDFDGNNYFNSPFVNANSQTFTASFRVKLEAT